MKKWILLLILINGLTIYSQEQHTDSIKSTYLEDQLYTSITYNILNKRPKGVKQNGFSGGFSIGFIKDIPFNKRRNFGIAIGVGYSYNAYIQNIKFEEINSTVNASITQNYKSNRYVVNAIEFPFEIRWRTSTPTDYNFTRIYLGGKLSYAFNTSSKLNKDNTLIKTTNIPSFNKLQYGLTAAIGYSTFNFYIYYGLKPMFKNLYIGNEALNLSDVQIGFKFYIL
ncbi:MAG: PorT family protein [Flavobacteriaceae bacterium]|nr:PorT family protein [Flavobacteriaceae bacterium]